MSIDTVYSLRITLRLKSFLEPLSPKWKTKLNDEIRKTMAKVIHESLLDTDFYIGKEDAEEILGDELIAHLLNKKKKSKSKLEVKGGL